MKAIFQDCSEKVGKGSRQPTNRLEVVHLFKDIQQDFVR